jgi:hypothetical protein
MLPCRPQEQTSSKFHFTIVLFCSAPYSF